MAEKVAEVARASPSGAGGGGKMVLIRDAEYSQLFRPQL